MAEEAFIGAPKITYIPSVVPAAPASAGSNSPKTIDEVVTALKEKFPSAVKKIEKAHKGDPFVVVDSKQLKEVILFLRDDSRFLCTNLEIISSTDFPPRAAVPATDESPEIPAREGWMENAYVLFSYQFKHQITVKAYMDRDHAKIDSIADLYRCANWYERECYDLLGVEFVGHPHLHRILLPEDWVGHPLRRDYVFPEEYNGMKVPL